VISCRACPTSDFQGAGSFGSPRPSAMISCTLVINGCFCRSVWMLFVVSNFFLTCHVDHVFDVRVPLLTLERELVAPPLEG
jgi:hypothetical protein